jgi:hypothetical protein
MTFELLSNATPWLVAFFAVVALGLGLAAYGVYDLVREQRTRAPQPAARTREQREVGGRLALHH